MNCPICFSQNSNVVYELYDDRYGFKANFNLLKCEQCRHQYLDKAPDSQELGDLYTDYYPRHSFDPKTFKPYKDRNKFYNWLAGGRANACQSVPVGKRVLDIGCGFGETLSYLEAKGCEAYGIDADRNVEVIAQRYGLKIDVGVFDASLYEDGFFDYVIMNQVIEHVPDLNTTFEMISNVLNKDGKCIMSTPNANGWGAKFFGKKWLNWHVPYHQQFLSKHSLYLLAEKYGFLVEEIQTITRSEWIMYQILHLMNYPKPGDSSAFWAPYATKRSFIKKWLQRSVVLSWYVGLPQLITRLFDSLGVGDNYLIILKKK
jgi:2-polyprenyl-3-methyl-5-hydroxy-6-metoxy-1,4-benzoquinol methylase